MEVIIEAEKNENEMRSNETTHYNGPCQCDSGWCTYDPDSNCWNDGD